MPAVTRAVAAFISSLALASAVVACGGNGGEAESRRDERAAAKVSSADLSSMVLSKDRLGPDFSDFRKAPVSGPVPNWGAAVETRGDDTSADLAERGRRDGYQEIYWISADAGPVEGVVTAMTYVELLESERAAGNYVDFKIEDLERTEGRAFDLGPTRPGKMRYAAVRTFEVADLGEKAEGVEMILEISGKTAFETRIVFQAEQIVATVVLASMGGFVDRDEAMIIAEALERRIADVVAAKTASG